ncbi:hypothetical protein [Neptunomonas marina]|uniref:PEP-CTERM sorting domain-containing protein n=1 Tax=Neptunomonas marina TaxID=1815562 RepID=A0A437QDD3_9GAMM|nr:hypothetical protein [Neptunomonas marina]RVU32548.1 hypothetical protein EOE65_02540 [Neptunomonas marina]
MKLPSLLASLGLVGCLAAMPASAAIINYAGYQYDDSSNVVVGDTLEWLRWDATLDLSINEALGIFAADGWRLALHDEVAGLYQDFGFGIALDANENTEQEVTLASNPTAEDDAANAFIELMGQTIFNGGFPFSPLDPFSGSMALYGNDTDGDGFYAFTGVNDDFTDLFTGYNAGTVFKSSDDNAFTADVGVNTLGVALVRDVSASVPLSSTALLFGAGVLGAAAARRR